MTLRVRLLSLTLAMVALVAFTPIALSIRYLVVMLLDAADQSSEYAGDHILSVIQRRVSETSTEPVSLAELKQLWTKELADDTAFGELLEHTMAQSRSIVEIDIAAEDGKIVASSNPPQVHHYMVSRQELHALREADILTKLRALLTAHDDLETRKLLGIPGQPKPIFTLQILVSPVVLRAIMVDELHDLAKSSSLSLIVSCFLAFWAVNLALRPLTRISHLIDDILSGKEPVLLQRKADAAPELVVIESKLSLLGERFRGARQDASQLRTNLEGVLEKLDAGTRQHLENQIATARRLTAINSLTSRVAHEIKNPLNSIALRLEMLRARVAEESPDSEAEFAILSEEVTRLDRVVRTFLDFNRPVDLVLADVNVSDSAAEILNLLEPEATQKGIEVSLDHPRDPVVVKADADLLRQALLNISINAIEAMDGGGRLRIEVAKNGETCSIRIRDTGPGIPKELRNKIFQLYYTTKPRGTGIGLAMTFRAVQLHGGTIEVEGESGKGTTFCVTLPLATADGTA